MHTLTIYFLSIPIYPTKFPACSKIRKKKKKKGEITIINIGYQTHKTDIKHRTADREKQGKNRGKLSTPH